MNYLFLHNNYPAQFRYAAIALAALPGNTVRFLSEHARSDMALLGIRPEQVHVKPTPSSDNPGECDMLTLLRRAEGFGNAMLRLRNEGFFPDVVIDHCGFACGAFAHDIFPTARRVCYFEWFYNKVFPYDARPRLHEVSPAVFATQRLRNQFQLDALVDCDIGICPTAWQKSQYPTALQSKIQVLHEGIDTRFFAPASPQSPRFHVPGMENAKEIVTYTSRALEMARGFPQFYKSLPAVLAARPDCHIVIMGDDKNSYDPVRPDGLSWLAALRQQEPFTEEHAARVHIIPFQPYPRYLQLLQSSDTHVYLTVPYVLSWSALEAMSTGCLLVASDTEPVREVLCHQENALLTPLDNIDALTATIITALERRNELAPLREAARHTVTEYYDTRKLTPRLLSLING